MHTFKDASGRSWSLAMSIGQARKLKDELKLDVLDGGESLTKLATNPYDTANALYLLCEAQCQTAGITDEQFGELLAGDVIDEATQALIDELVDFFPKRQRPALQQMLTKLSGMQDEAAKLGAEKIQGQGMADLIRVEMKAAAHQIDKMILDETTKANRILAGNSSGSALEPSAGTGTA